MFLAVDIGNSNIVVAIHDGKEWIQKYRFESKEERPEVFYITGLQDLLLEWGIRPQSIKSAGISSVVPHLNQKLENIIYTIFRFKPTVLGPDIFSKLDIHIPKIYEIGADLVANAYAAHHTYQKNTVVIDFGTALSFTIYNMEKGIEGVTIAPGLATLISTLSNKTAQLPTIEIAMPKKAIGTTTNEAITAGIIYGYTGLVKELLARIKSELDSTYQVVATGGLCHIIEELNSEYDVIDKNLTLEGIRLICNKNKD